MSVFIIAEAGVNHNGSIETARALVDAASDSGADAIKFQTFKPESLVSRSASKAAYQERATGGGESQYEMLKKLELSEAHHRELASHCEKRGIQFLSTPFDSASLRFLASALSVSRLKISSGDLTHAPLLLEAARTGKPLILSTGMSDLGEIEQALGVIAFGYLEKDRSPSKAAFEQARLSPQGRAVLTEKVTLLHCTTEYPAPLEEVNLRAMDTLGAAFGLPVGLSDHCEGIFVPIAAAARGARVIEKHFTLDRKMPGPDHRASLEPTELRTMVQAVRQIEKALGSPIKGPTASELPNRAVARRSLTASRKIQQGEPFTTENLAVKRPGTGVAPIEYWAHLGQAARRDYIKDEGIDS